MTNLGESIARLHSLREMIAETRMAAGMLELEIIKEFEANDQIAYEDTKFSVRIPTKREYDVARFKSVFGEILDPAKFNELYSEAHEVTKMVPASVNGVKAKKLIDQGFKKEIESVLLPNKRSLKIDIKKDEIGL